MKERMNERKGDEGERTGTLKETGKSRKIE